jgi:phage head maturation protease
MEFGEHASRRRVACTGLIDPKLRTVERVASRGQVAGASSGFASRQAHRRCRQSCQREEHHKRSEWNLANIKVVGAPLVLNRATVNYEQ